MHSMDQALENIIKLLNIKYFFSGKCFICQKSTYRTILSGTRNNKVVILLVQLPFYLFCSLLPHVILYCQFFNAEIIASVPTYLPQINNHHSGKSPLNVPLI